MGHWGRARLKMWEQGGAVRKWECHQTKSFSFQWHLSPMFFNIDMNQLQSYYSYYSSGMFLATNVGIYTIFFVQFP